MKSSREWMSISDMMTGLMMVFLFLAILYMNEVQKETKKVNQLTQAHLNYKVLILSNLQKEFQRDLKKWNAEIIEESLVVRFLSPNIMFNPMESLIKKDFKSILNSFCPRYFKILYKFQSGIEEMRIEGHTSSEWLGSSKKEAYFKNMKLSQDRTRSVLRYCTTIPKMSQNVNSWAIKTLTANGLSSSRPRCKKNTIKCRALNRRVEFRIQINESRILRKVIKEVERIFDK